MFHIHPRQNGFDLSITGHFLEVHVSEDDETCLYCRCNVTRGQGVKQQLKKAEMVIIETTYPLELIHIDFLTIRKVDSDKMLRHM